MATYFIHPNELKQTAFIDENVDDKILTNSIAIAQEMHLLPMLGTGLYNELKTQIAAGTLTALNTTLMSTYIVNALKYYSLYELIEPLNYKFTNKAIMKKRSENSEPIGFEEMTTFKDKLRNIAEWHVERMRLYLIENQTSYPLYLNPGTGVDIIHPKQNSYNGGWYLGDSTQGIPDWLKAEYPGTYGGS